LRSKAPEVKWFDSASDAKKNQGPEAVFKVIRPDKTVTYAVGRSRMHVCTALAAIHGYAIRGGTGGHNRRKWYRKEELAKMSPEQLAEVLGKGAKS
jgi:hypothetical protein